QLPVRIVGDAFTHAAAQPLRSAAPDLALDQQRVHDHATIMRDRVILNRDPAGVGIYLDYCDMHRIAPGYGRRLPIAGLLEPSLDSLRPAVIPAGPRRPRHFGEADLAPRHADDARAALAQFEIGRGAFEHGR